MARIRCIKPEFWTSEQIAECSPNARLLFIGMWSFCDDSGIHPASTKRLKMEVFPADGFSDAQVKALVDELVSARLLSLYEVSGQSFWLVTGWKHQKIDQPTFKHPLPSGTIPNTPDRRRENTVRSPNKLRTDAERSFPDVDLDVDMDVDLDIEGKVREIASLYPRIDDAFHLPVDIARSIAEAVARDGRDIVWVGTKAVNDATANWPKSELKFLPGPQKFFRESNYRRPPEFWERSNTSGRSKQTAVVSPSIERDEQTCESLLTAARNHVNKRTPINSGEREGGANVGHQRRVSAGAV